MLYPYKGTLPKLGEGVFLAPGARVIGRVRLEAESSVWFNVVIRADIDTVTVGAGTNVQDGTVIHCDTGIPTEIGANVTIGHGCIIHGCTIGDNCLIGMGSTILNGARIGEGSIVGAGSLVTEGKEFPPGSVIMGRPAKVMREAGEREREMIRSGAENYRNNARQYLGELGSV